jgi:hypothetical protein
MKFGIASVWISIAVLRSSQEETLLWNHTAFPGDNT